MALAIMADTVHSANQPPSLPTPPTIQMDKDPLAKGPLKKTDDTEPLTDKEVQKKLMNVVRRGVVIVKATSLAGTQESSRWMGTGFLVDKEQGLIATNAHVAGYHSIPTLHNYHPYLSVASYDVKFGDGTVLNAELLYVDPIFDFAFFKVDPKKLPSNRLELSFADKTVELNESIFSLGNSSGEEFSVISGIVYDIYSCIGPFMDQSFRYSGTTTGGASGSPVFNAQGKIVGIIYGGPAENVAGYALHGRYVLEALQALQKGKKPKRQDLGLRLFYQSVDDLCEAGLMDDASVKEYLQKFPHVSKKIVCIESVIAGSPAQKMLQEGDILWKVQGVLVGPKLLKISHMIDSAAGYVDLTMIRKGKKIEVSVPVKSFDRKPYERFVVFANTAFFEGSLHTRLATGDSKPGVYASTTSEASPLESRGYGMVKISEIDGKPIQTLDDLIRLIPSLSQEKRIEVRYTLVGVCRTMMGPLLGTHSLFSIVKNPKQFNAPKEFVCDPTTQQWTATDILLTASKPS